VALRATAEAAALPHVVAKGDLARMVTLNQARVYGAGLAGTPLGGVLFALSAPWPFVADAMSFVVAAGCGALVRSPLRDERVGSAGSALAEIREGLRVFWGQRFIRTTALLAAASDFAINAAMLIVVVAATRRGLPAPVIGLLLAAGSAGGLIGALSGARARTLPARALLVGAPLFSAGGMLLLAAPSVWVLGLGYATLFVAWPAWNGVITARWLTLVEDGYRGRVQAAARLVGTVPTIGAPAAAGLCLAALGVTTTCALLATVLCAVAILAFRHGSEVTAGDVRGT
jgi:hypothetical protein